MYDLLFAPFDQFLFLRRPLIACLALAIGCGPVGVLLMLRRMSLMGEAISHAILPGVALGFLVAGLSLTVMSLFGFFVGLLIAFLSGMVSKYTLLKEDASLAGFYLISLAIGVLLISLYGGQIDLMCVLFGTILSVTSEMLLIISAIASFTIIVLSIIYRPLLIECYDPEFLKSIRGFSNIYHLIFLSLIVLNLVAAFHTLGTLMALGLMMIPAIAARFWVQQVWSMSLLAIIFALFSGYAGLLLSYHYSWPSGPAIVIVAGAIYITSLLVGYRGSLLSWRSG